MLLYKIFSTILFIIILPIYYLVRVCQGKFLYGWNIKLGFFKRPDIKGKVIMFHGVSVGEVIALENLIKKTKEVFPDYLIVVTTGTKTGHEIAKKKFKDVAGFVTYFPFDIEPCVNRFLTEVKPSVVMIAETEIWPIFADACKRLNIPLFTINGRMSDSTYSCYKFLKLFFKHVLANYTGILTQSQEDADKLISIGANPEIVKVMKNLKFDVKKSNDTVAIGQEGHRIIIAGSTHKGENEIVISAFDNLKKDFPDIRLLIVPRHTNRTPEIKDIIKRETKLTYGLRSKGETFIDHDVIILDTMGELSKMYSICDFAFIGGSFCKTGGHNPLEASVYSKPVISGPDVHNFKDIYHILGQTKAGKVVKTPHEMELYMRKLLEDKKFYEESCEDCAKVFQDQQGALDVVINVLKNTLGE